MSLRSILREPLFHFALLGAVLFGLNRYMTERSAISRITVTKAQIARIADQYRRQYGLPPTPPQLEALVDKSITEEIFYREALKLGLGADDEIVRRRLVQKYEFLHQDLASPQEPTDAELLDFYRRHQTQYRLPERVTFTHVYFSPDQRGDTGARDAVAKLAATLNAHGATRASDQGDPYPGPYDFAALSHEEIQRVFGDSGLSDDIFQVISGQWSTPLRSGFGWHTVYVSGHTSALQAEFAAVSERVRSDYLESRRGQHNAEAIAKLRAQFDIVRQ